MTMLAPQPPGGAIPSALEVPHLSWVTPHGVTYPLDLPALATLGITAAMGVAGLGAAPVTITADARPRGGTYVRHIQPQPRTLTLPIYIEGGSDTEFRGRWRGLAGAFAETRRYGPGQLVVSRPDGTQRILDCFYQDGFDNNPDASGTWDLVAVTLYAPNPYWRDPTPIQIARAFSVSGSSFLNPFPTISSSQALGATTATNPGGVEAWPVWTITGPAGATTATNVTTGESWTLDPVAFRGSALVAGEAVTITTDPPAVSGPVVSGSTNWTGAMNWPGAILWALDPGDNQITLTITGAAAGSSIGAVFNAWNETA